MAQIPPKNAVVDPNSGMVTPEWLNWLQSIADASLVAGGTAPGTGGPTRPTTGGGGGSVSVVNDYGSGTPNVITKWLAAQTLGDSLMSEAGGTVTVTGTLAATVAVTAPVLQGGLDVSFLRGALPNAFLLTDVVGTPQFSQDVPFHLLPTLNETYDIGRFDRLWRNSWISKINAVVFALTTQTLFGGFSSIVKNAGTLAAGVANYDTTIDFGTAMPFAQWVLIRAHDAFGVVTPEYIQLGTLVSGTRYNVSRDFTGVSTPDPTWVAGTPWMLLGQTGDGRIDFFAYDGKPRMVFNVQTFLPQNPVQRGIVGNLNGYFGYVVDAFGACFGDPLGAWIKIDDIAGASGGVRLGYAGSTTVRISSAGASTFEAGITVGATGALMGGFATALDTGTGFYLSGAASTTFRVGVPGTTGIRWDGTNFGLKSASVTIDHTGIYLGPMTNLATQLYAYRFTGVRDTIATSMGLYGYEGSPVGPSMTHWLELANSGGSFVAAPPDERHLRISCYVPRSPGFINWGLIQLDAYPTGHASGLTSVMTCQADKMEFILGGGTAIFGGSISFSGIIQGTLGTAYMQNDSTNSMLTTVGAATFFMRGAGTQAFFPYPDVTNSCGVPTFAWTNVYCQAVVIVSDATHKRDLARTDLGLDFLERLPVLTFRYRTDAADAPERIGFTTQDVEAALAGRRFGGLHKSPSRDGLDYSAFVPVLTNAVQELARRVRALEDPR